MSVSSGWGAATRRPLGHHFLLQSPYPAGATGAASYSWRNTSERVVSVSATHCGRSGDSRGRPPALVGAGWNHVSRSAPMRSALPAFVRVGAVHRDEQAPVRGVVGHAAAPARRPGGRRRCSVRRAWSPTPVVPVDAENSLPPRPSPKNQRAVGRGGPAGRCCRRSARPGSLPHQIGREGRQPSCPGAAVAGVASTASSGEREQLAGSPESLT